MFYYLIVLLFYCFIVLLRHRRCEESECDCNSHTSAVRSEDGGGPEAQGAKTSSLECEKQYLPPPACPPSSLRIQPAAESKPLPIGAAQNKKKRRRRPADIKAQAGLSPS